MKSLVKRFQFPLISPCRHLNWFDKPYIVCSWSCCMTNKFYKIIPVAGSLRCFKFTNVQKLYWQSEVCMLSVPQKFLLRTAVQSPAAFHQNALNVRQPCSRQTREIRTWKRVAICSTKLFKILRN